MMPQTFLPMIVMLFTFRTGEPQASFNTFTTPRFEGTKKLFLKQQLMGVIHVDKGNKTAKGRWNMLCLKTDYVGDELESIISHGVYECEYRKEDGIWKISSLVFNSSFQTTLKDGWAKKTRYLPESARRCGQDMGFRIQNAYSFIKIPLPVNKLPMTYGRGIACFSFVALPL